MRSSANSKITSMSMTSSRKRPGSFETSPETSGEAAAATVYVPKTTRPETMEKAIDAALEKLPEVELIDIAIEKRIRLKGIPLLGRN